MAPPDPNAHSPVRPEATTRVDLAHRLDNQDPAEDASLEPPLDLLQAIAGLDSQLAHHQARSQALELAALLREKQRLLEDRESEINARAAVLENELRTARLRQQNQQSTALLLETPSRVAEHEPTEPDGHRQTPSVSDHATAEASVSAEASLAATSDRVFAWKEFPATSVVAGLSEASEPDVSETAESTDRPTAEPVDEIEIDLTASGQGLDFDFQREWEQLQAARQQLQERHSQLQCRQSHLEQLHDEISALHRDTLEMRMVTEQVWSELLAHVSRPHLVQTLTRLRSQLADHYRLANDTVQRRKDELLELQRELLQQEQRLRQHRREVQLWADRRYDEIEARAARLILREHELDQLENDLQSQSMQWQRQREAYREEIERLSWQLRESHQMV